MSFDTAISVLLDYQVSCVWDDSEKELSLLAYPISSARFFFVLAQTAEQKVSLNEFYSQLSVGTSLNDKSSALPSLFDFAQQHGLACFDSGLPWKLVATEVEKPWGKEVWYTGIEQRGVSGFDVCQQNIPISFMLDAHRTWFLQDYKAPILLKTLVPLPDEVYGDLYLELHEQKQEVYIVTEIDQAAWPQGEGAIRLGFNQSKLQQFGSAEAFTEAFGEAIKRYHVVRKKIDALQDVKRLEHGIALDQPVTAAQQKTWNQQLPADLQQQELQLREQMNSFTELQPLALGDVVKVPTLTPHALQHGVSVAEFQTPVYERKILSFAQKVLTQAGWDTDEALALMSMSAEQPGIKLLHEEQGVKLEEVVSFEDFTVQRLYLAANANWRHPARFYSLIFCIEGCLACEAQDPLPGTAESGATDRQATFAGLELKAGEAAYLCPQWLNVTEEGEGYFTLENHFQQALVLLIAQPRHYARTSS